MANQVFPTKGNLMAAKRSLVLAKLGYDLMDRKRNVLIRELMQLVDRGEALKVDKLGRRWINESVNSESAICEKKGGLS